MEDVLTIFKERGFLYATTDDEALSKVLQSPVTCYIGFDPTAASFHVGSLVPIMSLAWMQRCGHRPIALMGGGTVMIGDPSGRSEERPLLTIEQIEANAALLKEQFARFIDFEGDRALQLNNAEWLLPLNYIEFLRNVGRYFRVNRMLSAESVKLRLDSDEGMSFLEFNYQILQAYDFWHLYQSRECIIQMGGSDQWGNIVAGTELIHRMRRQEGLGRGEAYGITFPLISTSGGQKMGKSAGGAVWLDAGLTSPYEYYQYWVNTDDRDVERFLALFTFLPMDEVRRLGALEGAEINEAKRVLAQECTRLNHGEAAAEEARRTSEEMFGGGTQMHEADAADGAPGTAPPTTEIARGRFEGGMAAFELFKEAGLCKSGGEARRLIAQGGAYINEERVEAFDAPVKAEQAQDGILLLRRGKKRYQRVKVV